MIKANNPELKSWIDVDKGSDFPIQNIPFGIIKRKGHNPTAATRIGNTVIDLFALSKLNFLDDLGFNTDIFDNSVLNDFISLHRNSWRALRDRISDIFEETNTILRDNLPAKSKILFPYHSVKMQMPVNIGDYTDFYSSIEHATNVGIMFRDPANALLPNWKHIPVGYHGRSSSIVVSGTNIHRPNGQTNPDNSAPVFGPSKQFDFELEMAFITGKETSLGNPVQTKDAEEHIFGMVLFNDLSARDIQKWEYVPLGPFLGKSFGSVISPWIITLDALKPFKTKGPEQTPKVLPYLKFKENQNYDIKLDVLIQPENQKPHLVSHSNFKFMYWNMLQQLAHQTANGCNINVGDLYASGTISGPTPNSFGSMLELSWKGTKPINMPDGTTRTFINDNDTIIMKGYSEKNGLRIGFGDVITKVLPAKKY